MKLRRILLIALPLLLGAALLAGLLWWAVGTRPPQQKFVTADGTEFSVAKVSFGTNSYFVDGTWRDRLYPWLPDSLKRKSKWIAIRPARGDALMVWLKVQNPLTPGIGPQPNSPLPQVTVGEVDGPETRPGHPNPLGISNVVPYSFTAFPKRSRQILLRFYNPSDGRGYTPIEPHLLTVLNPHRVSAPSWTPETLPAIRETNGLKVSLLKVETGMGVAGRPASNQLAELSRLTLGLAERNQTTTNWNLTQIDANAATGETNQALTSGGRWSSEGLLFLFNSPLWIEEPAWKLKLTLARTSGFPPEELWTNLSIRLSGPGSVVQVSAHTNIYDSDVELTQIQWRANGSFNRLEVKARLNSYTSGKQLAIVEARDDAGRPLTSIGAQIESNASRTEYFRPPEGLNAISVTLAVTKTRTVEFLVKPELPK